MADPSGIRFHRAGKPYMASCTRFTSQEPPEDDGLGRLSSLSSPITASCASASLREKAVALSHHPSLITDYCFMPLRDTSLPHARSLSNNVAGKLHTLHTLTQAQKSLSCLPFHALYFPWRSLPCLCFVRRQTFARDTCFSSRPLVITRSSSQRSLRTALFVPL